MTVKQQKGFVLEFTILKPCKTARFSRYFVPAFLLFLLTVSMNVSALGQDAAPKEQVPEVEEGPVVTYLIEARLFPELRKITGTQTLSWRNTGPESVDHLRFHLYYNGFRSPDTTFMKEACLNTLSPARRRRMDFGEIKIKDIRRINGGSLNQQWQYISPDDNNPEDRTVMELVLQKPVEPGQTIRLKFQFELTIPQIFAMTGVEGDYFFIAQWFPKIGVLLPNGQWHCHQFHADGGFFSDYGDYRVVLTIPDHFVVGATGSLVKKEKNADKTYTYWYREQRIHDFAWTAYPHYNIVNERIQLKGRKEPLEIELLLSPGHHHLKDDYLSAIKFSLFFLARHIYPYPYKKLTVVDPPLAGIKSGGMEYPTLITGIYLDFLPDGPRLLKTTVFHQIAHQYWYGMVGSDETREAWLDEGVASFFEAEIGDAYFKDSPSLLGDWFLDVDNWEYQRHKYQTLLPVDPVQQPSWKFMNRRQYGANVYAKASLLLRSLANLLGREQLYGFFKYYSQQYQFKHPGSENFTDAFNTFMNEDFSWAFDWFIHGEGRLDHGVHRISTRKLPGPGNIYRSEAVFVRRLGYFPVELLIKLENGKEIKYTWRERGAWKTITVEDDSPIKSAMIDPRYKVPLDLNFLDNSKVRGPRRSALRRLTLKIGFLFQNILGALAF